MGWKKVHTGWIKGRYRGCKKAGQRADRRLDEGRVEGPRLEK